MAVSSADPLGPPSQQPHPNAAPTGFRLSRWIAWTTAGEAIGFLAPTAGFALAMAFSLTGWRSWALLVAAGAIEGSLLGAGQAHALRGTTGEVPRRSWIGVTAGAAAFAWALGMLVPTLIDLGVTIDLSLPITWVAIGAGGALLLSSIPLAQWTVLRHVVPRAWGWLPVNVAAWLIGLVFTFLPGFLSDENSPTWLIATSFSLGGIAMAVTVATITGLWLRRILGR